MLAQKYLAYALSYRDIKKLRLEAGLRVVNSTV